MNTIAYRNTCTDRSGGLRSIRLARASDISSVTLDDSRRAAVGIAGGPFTPVEGAENGATLTEQVAFEAGAMRVTHQLQLAVDPLDAATATLLDALADASLRGGLVAIVETGGGEQLVLGYSARLGLEHPLRLLSAQGSSGARRADTPARVITLVCQDCAMPLYLSES